MARVFTALSLRFSVRLFTLRSTLLQEIQLIHSSPDCQGDIGRRCCVRIDWISERSCQCWSGLTESQRVRIGDLATRCAAKGLSGQRRPERTLGVKVFVGVLTAGKNKVARQAIRDTWGSDPRLHRCIVIPQPSINALSLQASTLAWTQRSYNLLAAA